MNSAKDIELRFITRRAADALIKRYHYSGKIVRNAQLHIGVYLDGLPLGAMQFGPPLDKRKIQGLVSGTPWNGLLELNRMAFADELPRNSESRALGVAMRLIRRNYPQIEWVVSFADGTQCGDGTIYRAAGFVLTQIRRSDNLARLPSGEVIHKMTLESNPTSPRSWLGGQSYFDITGGKYAFGRFVQKVGGTVLPGYQLRYIYFLDPAARDRLRVPVVSFDEIDKHGAGMYKGKRRERRKQATSGTTGSAAEQHRPRRSKTLPNTATGGRLG